MNNQSYKKNMSEKVKDNTVYVISVSIITLVVLCGLKALAGLRASSQTLDERLRADAARIEEARGDAGTVAELRASHSGQPQCRQLLLAQQRG